MGRALSIRIISGCFFEQAKATGADTVEFRPPDETLGGEREKGLEIAKLAKDIASSCSFCLRLSRPGWTCVRRIPYTAQYAASSTHARGKGRALISEATEIGGVLYSRWPADYANDRITKAVKYERTMRSIECLRQVMPLAGGLNIKLNMEVLNPLRKTIYHNTVSEGLAFIRRLREQNAGLVIDVFHLKLEVDGPAFPRSVRRGHNGQFHASEPNRNIPHHNRRFDWRGYRQNPQGHRLRRAPSHMECVIGFDDDASYNLRTWRDLQDDLFHVRAYRSDEAGNPVPEGAV
jgi:D-psicose/D-tagatose/L-ribulose 3-epimerase